MLLWCGQWKICSHVWTLGIPLQDGAQLPSPDDASPDRLKAASHGPFFAVKWRRRRCLWWKRCQYAAFIQLSHRGGEGQDQEQAAEKGVHEGPQEQGLACVRCRRYLGSERHGRDERHAHHPRTAAIRSVSRLRSVILSNATDTAHI
jgi:hypothetical protein